jgi:hypothetical protein
MVVFSGLDVVEQEKSVDDLSGVPSVNSLKSLGTDDPV